MTFAMTLNNLAVLLKSAGRPGEAEPLCRQALVIFEETLGNAHPETLTCRENCE